MSAATIRQRTERANTALGLIAASATALATDTDDDLSRCLDKRDVLKAIVDAAATAMEEIYWLRFNVPGDVLETPLPDDDELEAKCACRRRAIGAREGNAG